MRKTADAVVIGGGIVGASIAYYLAKKGLREVVLLEKGEVCSGSSGDSAAIVRQHYSNDVSIRLVRRSLEIFQGFTLKAWIFRRRRDQRHVPQLAALLRRCSTRRDRLYY